MKKIFRYLLILSFGFTFSQKKMVKKVTPVSQGGYQISINAENLAGKVLKLSIYNGNYKKSYKIDSLSIKSNSETVSFKQNKKIIPLIYQLSVSGKPEKIDFFADNNSKILFNLKSEVITDISTLDPINKDFFVYQKLQNQEEKLKFLQALYQKYPNQLALKYFYLFEQRKNLKKPDNVDALTFRKNLLKDINVNDKTISILPNSYAFLNNYFTGLPLDNVNYKAGADLLLKNQNCNNNNFGFYIDWIYKNLDLYQTKNLNESAQYIFNTYVNNKLCMDTQKKMYDDVLRKLQSFTKLPVGSDMINFEMKTIDDKDFKFSDFTKQKLTLIMFFDPDCEHCKVEVPKETKEISEIEQKTSSKIGKIAVLNTQSKSKWKEFVEKNGLKDWENITYKENDTKTQGELDAFANPLYILVNQSGKIVYKKYNAAFIENFLKN